MCRQCGLILCDLNLPHLACPHCSSQILTSPVRASLLSHLEEQISAHLAKEARDREKEALDAKRAAGDFPALKGGDSAASVAMPAMRPRPSPPPNQTHKVMSLNPETKKVTVSSYTKSPVPSRPLSRADVIEEEPIRVSKPPGGVVFVTKLDPTRPWADLKSEGGVRYIKPARPIPSGAEEAGGSQWKKSRRNKGRKEKENDHAKATITVAE